MGLRSAKKPPILRSFTQEGIRPFPNLMTWLFDALRVTSHLTLLRVASVERQMAFGISRPDAGNGSCRHVSHPAARRGMQTPRQFFTLPCRDVFVVAPLQQYALAYVASCRLRY